jgi:hypothetical protein
MRLQDNLKTEFIGAPLLQPQLCTLTGAPFPGSAPGIPPYPKQTRCARFGDLTLCYPASLTDA